MFAAVRDQHNLVFDNAERRRFELVVDGTFVGSLSYRLAGGAIELVHAEVQPSMRGRGQGSLLVAGALDLLRHRSLPVRPLCPFVARFVDDHPEYASMVAN